MMEQIENVIELFFSLGLFINAMLFIPQIMRVFKSKSAKEVSFITFFGFLLGRVLNSLGRRRNP